MKTALKTKMIYIIKYFQILQKIIGFLKLKWLYIYIKKKKKPNNGSVIEELNKVAISYFKNKNVLNKTLIIYH